MHQFPTFTPAWNSTCFGQFLCPLSGVYTLYSYTRLWDMSYRSEDSFSEGPSWSCSKAAFKPVWYIPVLSVQWINSWWWAEELTETCRVSWRSKYGKLAHLVGFIIKKFVTMHGHMNGKKIWFTYSEILLQNNRICTGHESDSCYYCYSSMYTAVLQF